MKRAGLLGDTLTYGISEMGMRAASIIALPFYTRVFDQAEFGVLTVTLAAMALYSALLMLGGDSAFARFFFDSDDSAYRRDLTSTWVAFLTALSLVSSLALLPFAPHLARLLTGTDGYGFPIALALAAMPLVTLNRLLAQGLRNQFRAGRYMVLNLATALLSLMLALAFVLVLELGISGVLLGLVVAEFVIAPLRLWSVRSLLHWRMSLRMLRALLIFGVPLVPVSVAYWVFTLSDRMMLSYLRGPQDAGIFAVAVAIASISAMAVSAFGQAWSPHAFRVFAMAPQAALRLFGQVALAVVVVFGGLGVAVTAFADVIILFVGAAFHGAVVAVPALMVGAVALATTQVTAIGMSLAKRTSILAAISGAAALMNVGLNWMLIPPFGIQGAAWASAAGGVFLTICYGVATQRLVPIAYQVRRTALALVFALGFIVAARFFLPVEPDVLSLAMRGGYVAAFIILLFAFRVIPATWHQDGLGSVVARVRES